MPSFTTYEVEYTNTKPWNNMNLGSGKTTITLVSGTSCLKAKLKRAVERKINSLGVRIDSFKETACND